MKKLIRKILKESEFDWVDETPGYESDAQVWFVDLFYKCIPRKGKNTPPENTIYDLNGVPIMYQDEKNGYFWVDYDKIWTVFKSRFGLNYGEIRGLIERTLREHLNLGDYTAKLYMKENNDGLREHLNLGDYTAHKLHKQLQVYLREHLNLGDYTVTYT